MLKDNSDARPEFTNASLFVWLISISAIWAHTSQPTKIEQYWLHFDPIQTPAIVIAVVSALLSALFPTRTYVFIVFCVIQLVTIYIRIPNIPTHIVMEFLLAGSVVCAYLLLALRQKNFSVEFQELFNAYAPVARWLLIVMYFFGTFHKINPGFLSPDSSCAVPFIDSFVIPGMIFPGDIAGYIGIYTTLILEFAAMILLLNRKTKYYGMLLGMPFHIFIGISSFGVLAHFSVFAIALHASFLPSNFGKRVLDDSLLPQFFRSRDAVKFITVLVVVLQLLFARFSLWSLMNIEFLIVAVVVFTLILKYGKFTEADVNYRLVSKFLAINIFPVVFLFQSIGPYIGLSTTGAVQMFSGLRTEGGVSNHYLIKEPLYLFPYQRDVVNFDMTNDAFLDDLEAQGLGMNMFNYQEYLHRPSTKVRLPMKIRVNNIPMTISTTEEFQEFANRYFRAYSYVERKFLHFKLVDQLHPKQCRH